MSWAIALVLFAAWPSFIGVTAPEACKLFYSLNLAMRVLGTLVTFGVVVWLH
jgi:hypothetical protein